MSGNRRAVKVPDATSNHVCKWKEKPTFRRCTRAENTLQGLHKSDPQLSCPSTGRERGERPPRHWTRTAGPHPCAPTLARLRTSPHRQSPHVSEPPAARRESASAGWGPRPRASLSALGGRLHRSPCRRRLTAQESRVTADTLNAVDAHISGNLGAKPIGPRGRV